MLKILMVIMVSLTMQTSKLEGDVKERREVSKVEEPAWVDDKKNADVEEVKMVKYDTRDKDELVHEAEEDVENVEEYSEDEHEEPIYQEEYVEKIYYEEESDVVETEVVIEEYIVEEETAEYEYIEEEVSQESTYVSSMEFEATAYAIGDGLTPNTYTRNGTDVSNTIYTPDGYRVIAVDMNVIPLETIVRVTYSDGTTFLAKACDTGSAIVGNKIDILYGSIDEALNFGRQMVTVEILN